MPVLLEKDQAHEYRLCGEPNTDSGSIQPIAVDQSFKEHSDQRPAHNKGKKMNYSEAARLSMERSKTWEIILPTGESITVKNLRNFCKLHALNENSLRRVSNNGKVSVDGFKCRPLTDHS